MLMDAETERAMKAVLTAAAILEGVNLDGRCRALEARLEAETAPELVELGGSELMVASSAAVLVAEHRLMLWRVTMMSADLAAGRVGPPPSPTPPPPGTDQGP
jgi:hypothetical protein